MRSEEPKALSALSQIAVGSRQSAVGKGSAFGAHYHLKKSIAKQCLPKPFTIYHSPFTKKVIGHWALGIVCASGTFIRRLKKSVAKQRIPKSFIIHHSSFIIGKRNFCLRFLIPHSSFLIRPKGAS